jgi:uncharacterized protein with HEPN domain
MKNFHVVLKDMLAAIDGIEHFTANMTRDNFQTDVKIVSAVVRRLEIISEAAKHVPEEMQAAHPRIPWREIAAMHEKLAHRYFGMDQELLWSTIKHRLPAIKLEIAKMIDENPLPA